MEVIFMNISTIKKALFITILASAVSGFSSIVFAETPPTPKNQSEKQRVVEGVVNINHATAIDIAVMLKGIGLKKAEAIVEWRKVNGKFTHIEQLTEVKGIGDKTLSLNKNKISL
jgi:competence protein ComEA